MVDVGAKPETARVAVATAAVRMAPATLAIVAGAGQAGKTGKAGQTGKTGRAHEKGDVLSTARIAALAALKRTADIIPLCHPVRVVGSDVALSVDEALPGLRIRVEVHAFDRTGVEMEALVGASVGALTVYDMIKGIDRGAEISGVRLEEKRGGRSGHWRRGALVSRPRPR
jgi:cyclic pyranopterin monophosphate synthase